MQKIVVGGGCFWCVEAVFSHVKGVVSAISGYANGDAPNPDYEKVCTGKSGYAEVVEVSFDEDAISLEQILEIFWAIHDPTTPNRQGADIGSQYRSCIFFTDANQEETVKKSLQNAQKNFQATIVTQTKSLKSFYPAEEYHQNYFANNPHQGYCAAVVALKIQKFQDKFKGFAK
jgi:peptide-methionine (S)-S-oxide reductase